jgi:hypothetical protein
MTKVNKRGNNSKIIVLTETRHLIFVPGGVLSGSDTITAKIVSSNPIQAEHCES